MSLTVTATALLAAGTACASDSPEVAPEPATFTAHGRVFMPFGYGDPGSDMAPYCEDKFSGVSGTQVSVKDPSGEVIGFGVLSDVTANSNEGTCVAFWDAPDIPDTTDVLSYQIGQYEPVLFKQGKADSLSLKVEDEGEQFRVGVG